MGAGFHQRICAGRERRPRDSLGIAQTSSYNPWVELHPIIKHRNVYLRFLRGFCICAVIVLLTLQAIILHLYGQPTLSKTHTLMLWVGDVLSPENSQQLTDWYTFTHIIHGFIFYLFLWLIFPWLAFWQRFAFAVGVEVAWELVENTPIVIQHYRQQALAQGYVGDSIINSLSDTCAMIVGFFIAWRLPVLATISIGIFLELWTGYWIHDNLTLNILGFFWTPDFIARWQQVR